MRYIKHYFESIAGIEIYPIISLVLFMLFFVLLTIYVLRLKKEDVQRMANVPLDNDESHEPDSTHF